MAKYQTDSSDNNWKCWQTFMNLENIHIFTILIKHEIYQYKYFTNCDPYPLSIESLLKQNDFPLKGGRGVRGCRTILRIVLIFCILSFPNSNVKTSYNFPYWILKNHTLWKSIFRAQWKNLKLKLMMSSTTKHFVLHLKKELRSSFIWTKIEVVFHLEKIKVVFHLKKS